MKSILFIINLWLFTSVCYSQEQKGVELFDTAKIKTIKTKNQNGIISVTKNNAGFYEILVESLQQPKFIYNLSTTIPLKKSDYNKGRVFLLSFKAKTVTASLETGEAKAVFILNQTDNYKGHIDVAQSISSDWQTYNIPFEASKDIKKENLGIVIQYGYKPQSFLIKEMSFKVFPEGTSLKSLPKTKTTYTGMEANSEWRKKAFERIDSIRKSEFTIEVTKNKKPLKNIKFNIKLKQHAFPFGAQISAKDVVENTNNYKNFKKGFNFLVLRNDLKIKQWQKKNNQQVTLKALNILKLDGIKVKGHVLVWPGLNYLPKNIKDNKDNPKKVNAIIENHLNDILEATKDKVSHWDVVNEAYTNKDLQNITGSEEILYNGFRVVKQKQPNALRFVNEYGIVSKGGIDTQKQEWYYNYIKRIDKNTNGLVQGIGIQCHMGSDLTSPERVLKILDYYATLNKPISISEFTMSIKDPEIREQYTRDFMITAFSHPSVSEFLFWGNTENGRNSVDIFNKKNEIGLMGKAYFSLVHNTWKTHLTLKTNSEGIATNKGFFGVYEYSFIENGETVSGTFELNPNQQNLIKIKL